MSREYSVRLAPEDLSVVNCETARKDFSGGRTMSALNMQRKDMYDRRKHMSLAYYWHWARIDTDVKLASRWIAPADGRIGRAFRISS